MRTHVARHRQDLVDLSPLSSVDLERLGDNAVAHALRELLGPEREEEAVFARFDNSTA
ncbi:hypothetical protein ACIBG8_09915 [Nonomuraea sp. NPDC050556]|uniref:hypothetical protein n=1 Tax=Nonomuraea sp. NPDC050556 TaxID=3364369 RepID=UPI00379EE511